MSTETLNNEVQLPYDEQEEICERVQENERILLENVGAIEWLDFPVSPDGGVIVFKGRNGSGKSTGIDAVSCLLRGTTSGMPSLRDGAKRGKVEGFGASINLSISSRRSSGAPELVVDNIEGKFSISELVNPRSKSADAADKERLKALVTLTGKLADRDTFISLFSNEDEFRNIVSTSSLETTDPVEMARRIKADVDREARKYEEMAQQQQAKLEALKGTYSEFHEEDIIPNPEQFQRSQRMAIRHLSELEERERQNREKEQKIAAAKASISEVNVAEEERKCANAKVELENANTEIESRQKTAAEIQTDIEELEREYQKKRLELANKKQRNLDMETADRNRARQTEQLISSIQQNLSRLEGYQRMIEDLSKIEAVDPAEIQKYREMVDFQAKRADRNAIARQLQSKVEHVQTVAKEADFYREKSVMLRETGRCCDRVLSDLIGEDSPLKIVDGRMVLQTRRGETFFSDLSDGERWRVAFQSIAPYVRKDGEMGLVTIPQIGWESLDPENQSLIRQLAHKYRICVVTAEATSEELNVEVL